MPAAGDRLEQLECRLAELQAQNHLLEKQQAETKKEFMKEKRGKEQAMFYADSFALRLIGTLSVPEKELRAMKCELEACTKANANLLEGRDATEVRERAAEGKLRLESQVRNGMVREPPCFPLT